MKLLTNNKNKTKALLIAESEDDYKVLRFLYDEHICWGFYQILTVSDNTKNEANVEALIKRYPTLVGVGWMHCPTGFVSAYKKKEIK